MALPLEPLAMPAAPLAGSWSDRTRFHEISTLICRIAAAGSLVLLVGIAVLLVARRISGELSPSESPWPAIALAAIAAAASLTTRTLRPLAGRAAAGWQRATLIPTVLPSTCAALVALALSWPARAPLETAGVWLVLIAGEVTGAWRLVRRGSGKIQPGEAERTLLRSLPPADTFDQDSAQPDGILAWLSALGNRPVHRARAWQTQRRRQIAGGGEEVTGTLRVRFARGERTQVTHVAFCPPLVGTPHWSASQHEGPRARLKATHLLPQGARIEIRLVSAATRETEVVLSYACRGAVTATG